MKITAAVLRAVGQPFSIESVTLDDPGPGEVLVEIAGTGVCHTDISFKQGHWPFPVPSVLGHEGAGRVAAVGAGVTSLAVGDHVVMSNASCGACPSCLSGMPAWCPNASRLNNSGCRPDGSSTLHDDAGDIHGNFVAQSSFASHALSRDRFVVKVPEDIPLHLVGSFGCGIQTGAGAVLNVLKPAPGSTALIVGLGAVGLAAVAAAAASGCSRVLAADMNPDRFDAARTFGATDVIDASAGPLPELVRALLPTGVDAAVEASGSPRALRSAFESTHGSGRTVLVGAAPHGTEYALDSRSVLSGRTLVGAIMGLSNPRVFIPRLVDMYRRGQLPMEKIVQTYPLADIEKALADSASGAVVKPVVIP
ncbi:Aryl-alcohol dehydrogenase [Frankia canadensis]|uniref:Aryl-alcohol dehydrogenase n=1 Tax=Frankia canadensis TaxID=1836972 RepID=A0A2I2KI30_9ACTN|nr:NAD(P)-dependent alcohol dehydrogenase [Frankia canadensis]SNQ45325.1 Aryl-alcohol dehydrogenase [Frankia canadensis]SOU52615.1 Aryl-alcohol dehydrogenase [Frankia canadensis]